MTNRTTDLIQRIVALGFTTKEAWQLRRIEKTLHRWAEQTCGVGNGNFSWSIERDETTGKPFCVTHSQKAGSKARRESIPDRENGALRRLAAITVRHPEIYGYHQTDPRGCALYLLRASDVRPGEQLDSVYPRGLAVCS
jgi:hypothetical protein